MRPAPTPWGSISLEAAGQAAQAASSRRAPGRSQAVRPAPTPWGKHLPRGGGTSRAGGLQPPGPRKVPSRAARAHALGEASPRGGAPILFKARRAGSTGQARRFLFYLQYTTDKGKRKQTGVGLPVGYLMSGPLARRGPIQLRAVTGRTSSPAPLGGR